jgi:cytochrome c oxidase assembly protein subunit 20
MSESPEVLRNPPCFRSGLMWGIATGVLIGGHRFRTTRAVRSACDWAIVSFGSVAAGTWCGSHCEAW